MSTKILNTKQVAERLQVSTATVTRYIREGRIKAYRVPGQRTHWRIPEDEVERIQPKEA